MITVKQDKNEHECLLITGVDNVESYEIKVLNFDNLPISHRIVYHGYELTDEYNLACKACSVTTSDIVIITDIDRIKSEKVQSMIKEMINSKKFHVIMINGNLPYSCSWFYELVGVVHVIDSNHNITITKKITKSSVSTLCPECRGTKMYVGFIHVEPCSLCCK